jgi:hypothetical protein
MVWITLNEEDNLIIAEIASQSDRGAALIAQAYLEDRLVAAIKARLVDNDDVLNRLFKGTGPLASFSSRIDIGLALGLYQVEAHKLFRQIKDIRNDFAHKARPLDFTTPSIADRCNNLNIRREGEYLSHLRESETYEAGPAGTPREAFINAIKFLMFVCDRELKLLPPRNPAPPVVMLRQASPETL